MARICTTRNAEVNKNVSMQIANRTSNTPQITTYGEELFPYGQTQSVELCLMPFKTEIEAKAYGVSLLGGRRATLTLEQASLFNEFTHIWVDKTPDADKQETEYVVKDIRKTLNNALIVIDIKDGSNGL